VGIEGVCFEGILQINIFTYIYIKLVWTHLKKFLDTQNPKREAMLEKQTEAGALQDSSFAKLNSS